ncbi:MAG: DUF354 domain-containing protein [Syntrophobacteraceae bacterium]
MSKPAKKKIWIDLDNTPHVPFFKPIIEELNKRGYPVFLTARDCFQVCGLADLSHLKYKRIGRHYGKNVFMKVFGLVFRSLQLSPIVCREKPDLVVSHGSRSQQMLAEALRIPTVIILDYEYAKVLVSPTWVIAPEIIPTDNMHSVKKGVLKYPGIKEDVYVPDFRPDPSIMDELKVSSRDIMVTIRPPATEAHYHNPESEQLFAAVMDNLGQMSGVQLVLLPRNGKQAEEIKSAWPDLFKSRKAVIPEKVVDGLNLIWHSDLVISGGGTMNREAAALGVPVYSIFRGKIGAVDKYLAGANRLTLLTSVSDVLTKIKIEKRTAGNSNSQDRQALLAIVEGIIRIAEN